MLEQNNCQCIVYTSGEPAGIGPQLAYFFGKQAAELFNKKHCRIVVLGDRDLIKERCAVYGSDVTVCDYVADENVEPDCVYVQHVPLAVRAQCGVMDVKNAPYVLKLLDLAHEGLMSGQYAALITGPISKSIIAETGLDFTGHTEYLQQKCGVHKVVMLLGCTELKVALVTTHLPINAVSAHITQDNVRDTLKILHHDLKTRFHIADPLICVAGLNPHAGEDGLLGHEEQDVIIPVLEELRAQGMRLEGPIPADTLFTPQYLTRAAAMLCMYHDQGLPVLKYVGFDHGYNTTLGLPYIRTSVDHGTALSLAGTPQADGGSLLAALDLTLTMLNL